jgi:hypothetical protein
MSTISSANSVFTIVIPGLYPAPQTLQQWAADDAFAFEGVDLAETIMGVDGHMAAGFTPAITPMTISFMADSPSIAIFDYWGQASKRAKEIYRANATVLLPSIGKAVTLNFGVLKNFKAIPDVKKVLQAQTYTLHWESVDIAIL